MLEISRQTLSSEYLGTGYRELAPAESNPLPELLHYLPTEPYELEYIQPLLNPTFSFSNDESAAYYQQTSVRRDTSEFLTSSNRTALLVGEASLAAALGGNLIPEDTIILVDTSQVHNAFMVRYIHALRSCKTPGEWQRYMGLAAQLEPYDADGSLASAAYNKLDRLLSQAEEWRAAGIAHALQDPEAYNQAQQRAKDKAIVVWNADLASSNNMQAMGHVLKQQNATITFANMTNVLSTDQRFLHASQLAENLAELPFSPTAPILTSSRDRLSSPNDFIDDYIVQATGPFFGLENLRVHGGATNQLYSQKLGSAVKRQLAFSPPEGPNPPHDYIL